MNMICLHRSARFYCSTTMIHHKMQFMISSDNINSFADLTGDFNPIHTKDGVVHGTYLLGLVSGIVAKNYPKSRLLDLNAKFTKACLANTNIEVQVSVPERPRKLFKALFSVTDIVNGDTLVLGDVKIMLHK